MRARGARGGRARVAPRARQCVRRVGDPAEDAALRLDHLQRDALELGEVRADAVGQHDAFVAAVVRLAHRRVHAHLGGDAADDQRLDAAVVQDEVEVGGEERALAGLVDHDLARLRRELGHDVVAVLAAHQDAPIGPGSPMRLAPRPRTIFVGGQSARSGLWPSRVWITIMPVCARRVEHAPARRDHRLQRRDVVAERLAEAARLDEVALHVDDDERRRFRVELELIRFGVHRLVVHRTLLHMWFAALD